MGARWRGHEKPVRREWGVVKRKLLSVVLLAFAVVAGVFLWRRGGTDLLSCLPEGFPGEGGALIRIGGSAAPRPEQFLGLEELAPLIPSVPVAEAARLGAGLAGLLEDPEAELLVARSASGDLRAAVLFPKGSKAVRGLRGGAAASEDFQVRGAGLPPFAALRPVREGVLLLLAPDRAGIEAMDRARSERRTLDRRTESESFVLIPGDGEAPRFEAELAGDETGDHWSIYRAASGTLGEEYKGDEFPLVGGGRLAGLLVADFSTLWGWKGSEPGRLLAALAGKILPEGTRIPDPSVLDRVARRGRLALAVLRFPGGVSPLLILQSPEAGDLDRLAEIWGEGLAPASVRGFERVRTLSEGGRFFTLARSGKNLYLCPLAPEALAEKARIPGEIKGVPAPRDRLDLVLLGAEREGAALMASLAEPLPFLARRLTLLAKCAGGTNYLFARIVSPERGNLSLVRSTKEP
jgi:hypothetical protein